MTVIASDLQLCYFSYMSKSPDFNEILRKGGSKATPGRIELLKILWHESKPVSAVYLQKKLPLLNEVTLYRALEAFTKSGIVNEVDFRHGHAYYELNVLRDHHHHIVCTKCGVVKDIACTVHEIITPKEFTTVTDHAMEFFGVCNKCAPSR